MEPVVLEGIGLSDFLERIISEHAKPTTLIVCSTKAAFLHDLLESVLPDGTASHEADEDETGNDRREPTSAAAIPEPGHRLLQPTLHLLSKTWTIDVAFCPDLPHLLARLSVLTHQAEHRTREAEHPDSAERSKSKTPLLAIINPIELHRHTSSFSVQGLNRTFAAATEAAHLLGRKLVIAECGHQGAVQRAGSEALPDHAMERRHRDDRDTDAMASPWDEEVSMLNVTTKTFGAGERGWVGRTVSIRRIAERWCRFERVSAEHDAES